MVGDVGVAAGELLHDGAELLGAGGELHGAGYVHHLDTLASAAALPPGPGAALPPPGVVVVVHRRLGDAVVVAVVAVVPVLHAQLAVHVLSLRTCYLSVERTYVRPQITDDG